jgi:PAS domain S-box-containing protein
MTGYTRADQEAGLVRWDAMTPPEYADLDIAHIREAAERGSCTPYQKEYIRKDGNRVPILCGYALLEGSQDEYIGFVLDLSEQKRAERELREREERFRVLAESLPEFVWMRDGDGDYVYCNQRLLDYVGQPTQWLRTNAFEAVHPDDRAGTIEKWKRSLETGEIYLNEYRLRRHDGTYRYFLARAVPVRDETGRVQRWLGSSTDVHDQKLAEEAIRRSEKLATAGRLAASMAHEINNPLNAVVNTIYLALKDEELSESTRSLLESADLELARVGQYVTQTLRFHKQSTAPSDADLGEIMDSVLAMYAPRFRSASIRLQKQYRTQEKLRCFSSELRQVFANLVGNALDATGEKGLIQVRVRAARSWTEPVIRGIRVLIADTGAGIPPELRAQLFEPFVSTKESTGVGLGLWVSQGLVHKHNGRISLRTRTHPTRHGTLFSIFFPFL